MLISPDPELESAWSGPAATPAAADLAALASTSITLTCSDSTVPGVRFPEPRVSDELVESGVDPPAHVTLPPGCRPHLARAVSRSRYFRGPRTGSAWDGVGLELADPRSPQPPRAPPRRGAARAAEHHRSRWRRVATGRRP